MKLDPIPLPKVDDSVRVKLVIGKPGDMNEQADQCPECKSTHTKIVFDNNERLKMSCQSCGGTFYKSCAVAELPQCDPNSGFTPSEKRCHDALMQSYKEFIDMPREHPDEMRDFVDAVHKIQGILTTRIVRRVFPAYWPTHSDIPDDKA